MDETTPTTSVPVNQSDVVVTLEVSVNELNVVFAGLQELPHRAVDVLIRKLVEQAQKQVNG